MNVLYSSQKGGKPLMIGMNHAKRMARRMDKRDQLAVIAQIGPGMPRQHQHHTRLVQQRHAAINDRGDAYVERQRILQAAQIAGAESSGDPQAGGHVGAVPESPPGPAADQRDDGPGPV